MEEKTRTSQVNVQLRRREPLLPGIDRSVDYTVDYIAIMMAMYDDAMMLRFGPGVNISGKYSTTLSTHRYATISFDLKTTIGLSIQISTNRHLQGFSSSKKISKSMLLLRICGSQTSALKKVLLIRNGRVPSCRESPCLTLVSTSNPPNASNEQRKYPTIAERFFSSFVYSFFLDENQCKLRKAVIDWPIPLPFKISQSVTCSDKICVGKAIAMSNIIPFRCTKSGEPRQAETEVNGIKTERNRYKIGTTRNGNATE